MKKAVTIKDIAEQLNLSRNTVAKALNGQYVPEKTRETVLKKAQELNYKSLNLSRIEVGNKKYRLLLISGKPLINMNYFISLIKGVENYCYERNYELFQYTFNSDKMPFKAVSDYVKELNADGIIAIECFDKALIEKLLSLGKPVCFNDFSAANINSDKPYDIISANDEKSVYDMVKTLNRRYNITRFTFVGDFKHCLSFCERYTGMLKAIMRIGAAHSKHDDILCNDASFNYGDPNALKTEILKLKYRPQCFICCNDFVARTLCNALKTLGVNVPQNALVVGFDNVAEAVALTPAITSFSVPKEFLGAETVRTLINRIENPSAPSRVLTVATTLIQRESTCGAIVKQ
ncbi:MAG: LacI family transcriptional regulator [Clostridia bacterium]|nr:LacI family transcriptional regulator [Clostridia bacterium]